MPDYSQKGYLAKCAGMADNLIKELKNRPSGVFRAAFLRELCIIQAQFNAWIWSAVPGIIRQFLTVAWEMLSGELS